MKRVESREIAQVANPFAEIGAEGFANWLVEAWAGPDPHYPHGFLHYDEDISVQEKIEGLWWGLPGAVKRIAQKGVLLATERFIQQAERPTVPGIMELCRMACTVQCSKAAPKLQQLLNRYEEKELGGEEQEAFAGIKGDIEFLHALPSPGRRSARTGENPGR